MGSFEIKSKTLFITYPQSDFTHDELYEFFTTKFDIIYCIIARETHTDGNFHIHSFVKLARQCRIRDSSYLDYKQRHPNIQSARNKRASITYCKKEGDFKEYGSEDLRGPKDSGGGLAVGDGESYFDYLDRCYQEGINI